MSASLTTDEMIQRINDILPPSANLIKFSYNPECFGNILVQIKMNKEKHSFVTDRGEIYHNNRLLCNSSYCNETDVFTKLIEMIKNEICL